LESTRLKYHHAIARVFETIIKEGIAAGEFRELDVEVAGACLVGAFMDGLISVLAPGAAGVPTSSRIPSPISASPPSRSRVECRPSSGPPSVPPNPSH
jgi:hypothetical protein